MRGVVKAILVAGGLLSAASAFAADLPTKKEAPAPIPEPVLPSTWHFEATLDGWAPSLNASMGVRNLPAGFVRVTAGRQRVAQHAHPQATFKPRGRATRPMWQSVSACRLGGSSGRAVRVPTAGVPHFRAR